MRLDGIEDVYDLSAIQEGLLFHNLMAPGSGVYLEQITLTLRGELDVAAFSRAWQTVVDRHPILRTSFHWEGVGKAVQVVHQKVTLALPELDWRELSADAQVKEYEHFALTDRMQGFAFDKAPLMRMALIRLKDDTWSFFWSFSHLLLDGWSFGLCFMELTHLFNAYVRGEEPQLQPARQYRDYLAWWKRQDIRKAEEFWTEYLAGYQVPDALELGSIDRRVPGDGEPSHGMLPDRDLIALVPQLAEIAAGRGITVNTIMQGAWMLLLSRYLDSDDVVAGSTGTQRPAGLPGAEMIMGPMLATMPVRARVDLDAELVPWLLTLQQDMAQAREHADIPLPELRKLAGLSGGTPLFDMDLAYENVPVPDMILQGVEIVESTYDGRPHFPITMIIMPGERLPVPRLVYDRTRFPDAAASRLIEHFYTVLTAIIDNPERRLGDLPVLPESELDRLADWNRSTPQPQAGTLHDIFAARARETPDAVAVVCGEAGLTYSELDRLANQLAHHLTGLGAGPGQRIGLCLDRSPQMLTAILGVLKSGAAYVPLDLSQPGERMDYILRDAEVMALVTHRAASAQAPAFDGPVVDLDADAEVLAGLPVTPPVSAVEPDGLAYIIYTSGSTGRPKGVLVSHANVARLVSGAGTLFDFGPSDVWSMFHSYAFDVSVFETWGAFCNGATLVVVPHDVARSPEALHQLVTTSGVTVFSQTPSAFRQYAAAALDSDQAPESLRYVVFAGEYLDATALEAWVDRFGEDAPQLVNMYGITETTVHSTFHRVTGADVRRHDGTVPSSIGRALPDMRIYVLDQHRRRAPIGVRGEMYVAGAGVALGYQNLPELTEQRFLPDPFSEDPAARMYRSGDLARYLENGELEFLGRSDFQVKIRGFRVELGEIEAVLREHPQVSDVVVLAREDTPGDQRLIGYVVASPDSELPAELRALARHQLPEYMVPSAVVVLDALPLTANGKTDRAALPQPDGSRPETGVAYVPPVTPHELKAAEVWAEVLGVDRVGLHDDFFALGGHSLLATRVVFQLSASLGVEVPVRALFDRPTIAGLLEGLDTTEVSEPETAIGRAARVPLTAGK